jgi:hypothetical protein
MQSLLQVVQDPTPWQPQLAQQKQRGLLEVKPPTSRNLDSRDCTEFAKSTGVSLSQNDTPRFA